MSIKLEKFVPFGRSFDEYRQIFALSEADLSGNILGVGDGPASFNAEATAKGYSVTSIDPVYKFSGEEIYRQFDHVLDTIIDQVIATPNDWIWSYHRSPNDLRRNRIQAIQRFISDYQHGKQAGRYQVGSLPSLTFKDDQFDLALCSHLLFLYSDHYDAVFHQQAVQEMLRVSQEVRIFPLLTLMLQPSPYLDRVIHDCVAAGHTVTIEPVFYELQRGGNQMLRIRKVIKAAN
ncbi:class I SAM-dependent methyltransferase [Thermocoleostomius sinensis]|uniref:Class I SAM-dependent methyltransferase n=1 Tax=Thermocoleostomius sinensis A174 TaxID=2016057 RepID=A0A9E8ZI72_9CYAN|nr:class I SAM-dependent methyltransferase [Thermocoleostomius sinensis]WAL58976.1 class I SAM-dependent methyltransferase [Thermocoleostomius sinensis A174]